MFKNSKKRLYALPLCVFGLLTLLAVASASAQSLAAAPAPNVRITPPPVPANIQVPESNEVFLVGHGVGTQNYECQPSGSGVAWVLFTPQATLFTDQEHQVTTHFFSPNPFEGNTVRATWQHSRDTSTVWGRVNQSSSDPNFVEPGAIPWLLVQVKGVGTQAGPTGGDKLTATTFIQRLKTTGGSAPSTGCSLSTDIGNKAFVPYTADYFFYKDANGQSNDK